MAREKGSHPNIILFMSDDVGWGDLGATAAVRTAGRPPPTSTG